MKILSISPMAGALSQDCSWQASALLLHFDHPLHGLAAEDRFDE